MIQDYFLIHRSNQILPIVLIVFFTGLEPNSGLCVVSLVFNMKHYLIFPFDEYHRKDVEFFSVHPIGVCALLICCINGDINSYCLVKSVCQVFPSEVNKSGLVSIHGEIL